VLTLRAILRLTRLDSSLLGFFAIFLPFTVRTNDPSIGFGRAIPLLFICMCTFVANDLGDVEKDRINHPDRPLPAGHLTCTLAAVLYFTFLGLGLFTTRHYISPRIAFWYYALMTVTISYGYVVECLPGLKAPYVATAVSVPILIVAASYPDEPGLNIVAVSTFLFTLGREICMDILDRDGDAISFMHKIRAQPLVVTAYALQGAGVLLLLTQADKSSDFACLFIVTLLLVLSGMYWFKSGRHNRAIAIMKIEFFLGLYFLI
jgi:4-hydroxybenzoate polyprenyltransferase